MTLRLRLVSGLVGLMAIGLGLFGWASYDIYSRTSGCVAGCWLALEGAAVRGGGSSTWTVVPCSGVVLRWIRPWWALTTDWAMDRPSPDPGRVRLVSPRQKRSKACADSAGSIPGPVSVTSRRAELVVLLTRTMMDEVLGV